MLSIGLSARADAPDTFVIDPGTPPTGGLNLPPGQLIKLVVIINDQFAASHAELWPATDTPGEPCKPNASKTTTWAGGLPTELNGAKVVPIALRRLRPDEKICIRIVGRPRTLSVAEKAQISGAVDAVDTALSAASLGQTDTRLLSRKGLVAFLTEKLGAVAALQTRSASTGAVVPLAEHLASDLDQEQILAMHDHASGVREALSDAVVLLNPFGDKASCFRIQCGLGPSPADAASPGAPSDDAQRGAKSALDPLCWLYLESKKDETRPVEPEIEALASFNTALPHLVPALTAACSSHPPVSADLGALVGALKDYGVELSEHEKIAATARAWAQAWSDRLRPAATLDLQVQGSWTHVSYVERSKAYVSLDVGLLVPLPAGEAALAPMPAPYFAASFNLGAALKDIPLGCLFCRDVELLARLSFLVGFAWAQEDHVRAGQSGRAPALGDVSWVLGAGFRFTDYLRLTGGFLVTAPGKQVALKRHHDAPEYQPFLGLSIDFDVADSLSKGAATIAGWFK